MVSVIALRNHKHPARSIPSLHRQGDPFASHISPCGRMGYAAPFTYRVTIEGPEVAMAKGQMRSNREKKKPKQDKNKKKGAEAPSPFAGMRSQVTSYTSQYGKKH